MVRVWILGVCLLVISICCARMRADEPARNVYISDEVLRDKIRGGIIGEIFGDLNGLPHEMKYIDLPGAVLRYTPSLPNGAWTDDDTDIEWVHHFEMDNAGTIYIPYPRVTELWKAHINKGIWTANAYARRLMDLGVVPPYTGRIAINPVSVFNISGEFCAESFGLVAPAMPQTASRIGLHYTHITIDGEPAQQTQLFDTMIAMAFVESDVDRLIDAGVAALDPESELIAIIKDTRTWCAQNPDWHETRKLIHDKYTLHRNELPDKNGYQLNTAAILAALLYGKGDYAETIRMTFNFGWDADCTSATAGTIIGTIKGGKWFDAQGWALKDVYRNTCRDGMPKDETITSYADRVYRISNRVIIEGGGEERQVAGKRGWRIHTQIPANVEPLPKPLDRVEELKKELLPAIERDLTGSATDKARAAYLAICLGESPRLAKERTNDWKTSLAELKTHTSLINMLYAAPPSVASGFQARFRAAGVAKSEGEMIKPAATNASEQPWIEVSKDKAGFVLRSSHQRFVPWGFNYDHDEKGRLIEDYWASEWPKIETDFVQMRKLGANVVRIHLQLGKFMEGQDKLNDGALDRLSRLVHLAEVQGIYLDLTGLGCYHKKDVPQWYEELDEKGRWRVQARFWRAVAQRCAQSPAVFCYDLMNEPVVPGGRLADGDWLGPPFAGSHFVQFITLDQRDRPRSEIARQWIRHLTAAIRGVDQRHLITVGLVDWSLDRPGLTSGFVPDKIAADLDFLCVHLYPGSGTQEQAMRTLEGFSAGAPVMVEETFPLQCSPEELDHFIDTASNTQPVGSVFIGESLLNSFGDPTISQTRFNSSGSNSSQSEPCL